MEYKDYYKILGISRDASEQDIKRAYRRLAREHHPDANPDDPQATETFKEINEAYQVLSDPDKRVKYDRFGSAWDQHQQSPGKDGFNWGAWSSDGSGYTTYTRVEDIEDLFGGGGGFSDFFETLFGQRRGPGGARRTRARRGQDIEQPINITLAEAYHGGTRRISKEGRQLDVKIPPGVRSGSKIRLSGEGMPGVGSGDSGDLYLVVNVLPDARFERQGDNLYVDVEVPLYTAVLGGKVEVPTIDGSVMLTIPPGTDSGKKFRLRGKGMPLLKSPDHYGDLYATVYIQVPKDLSAEERKLFKQLADLHE